MDIRMCRRDGCYEPAIGVGQIRDARGREPGRRRQDECRVHYLDTVSDELVQAEVIGDVPIADARTTEAVEKGGTVWLDPATTAIEQLVYCRFIRVASRDSKEPAKKTSSAKG